MEKERISRPHSEDGPLKRVSINLNPEKLKVFDSVIKKPRSQRVRELIEREIKEQTAGQE